MLLMLKIYDIKNDINYFATKFLHILKNIMTCIRNLRHKNDINNFVLIFLR